VVLVRIALRVIGGAVLAVAVGVAGNQVLNDGKWNPRWLAGAVVLAVAAECFARWLAPRDAAPEKVAPGPVLCPGLGAGDGKPLLLGDVRLRDLGVHPSRFSGDGDSPYISRQADGPLGDALTGDEKRLVIVEGPRLAGTTRVLAEAVRAHLPSHLAARFIDDPRVPLADMIGQASQWADEEKEAAGAVVWFERLSPERFTEVACYPLDALPSGVMVLATFDSADRESMRLPEQVAALSSQQYAALLEVGCVTGREHRELLAEDCYAVLRPVLGNSQDLFMGRLMIAWEPLRAALTRGRSEQSADEVALLRAVTDWDRARVPRLLTDDVLVYLYRAYRRETAGAPGGPVSVPGYNEALQWATAPPSPDRPRLVDQLSLPGGVRYAAHPLLAVIADDPAETASWPVSDVLWSYAGSFLDGEQRRDVGYSALARGARHAAARLLGRGDATVDSAACGELGLLFYDHDEWEDSRKWWQAAVSTGRGDHVPGTMINLAVLEGKAGNTDQARDWYKQAIEFGQPATVPWAMFNLGGLEERQGNPDEARRWYRAAIETGHREHAPTAMVNISVLEAKQGDPDEARRWYRQAAESGHPEQGPKAVFGLGLLDMETGNPERARRHFDRAIKTGHADYGPSAMSCLAVLAEEQGRIGQARRWYRRAAGTGHHEHAPKAMLNLAVLEASAGNTGQARDLYRQVIESGQPEAASNALFCLANLESSQGNFSEARQLYRQAIDGGRPEIAATAMTNLGNMESSQGNVGEARRWYQQAITTSHPDAAPKAMLNLGVMEARLGNHRQARRWYQQAAATSHTDVATSASQALDALDKAEKDGQRAQAFSQYGYLAYADPALMKQSVHLPIAPGSGAPDHCSDPGEDPAETAK
jgi:tetratricopeptide (TPR) repeat protein